MASACLVVLMALLEAHDANTERILAAKQAQANTRLKQMEDDFRKIMKEMGFNVLILPAEDESDELRKSGRTMPEQYVTRLANSRTITVRHLLPILYQNIVWPETGRSIYLVGTRGEVPLIHRDPKKPIQTAVEPGHGGQDFLPEMLAKIETIRGMLRPEQRLEVDGGINCETAVQCAAAGADVFVAGNYVFCADDIPAVMQQLRKALGEVRSRD